MVSPDYNIPPQDKFEPFQAIARDGSPVQVATQTGIILDLLFNNRVANPRPAREYLGDVTMPYLQQARDGIDDYFSRRYPPIELRRSREQLLMEGYAQMIPSIPEIPIPEPETREATDHVAAVFAHMHDVIKIRELPMGFSKRGMLGYPLGRRAFALRVIELQHVTDAIRRGQANMHRADALHTPEFRTYAFFKTAALLPEKFPQSEKEQAQEMQFLTEGIETQTAQEAIQQRQERASVNRLLADLDI